MSEAEVITAFQGYLAQIYTVIFGYVSLLSGFLVMSYLVAHKLTNSMVGIIFALFTAVCVVLIINLQFLRTDFSSLQAYILEQMASGSLDLPWYGNNPAWAGDILTALLLIATVGGYVGSLAFFFVQRRSRR